MHAAVKAALASAALATIGYFAGPPRTSPSASSESAGPSASPSAPPLVEMPCPARHLPEGAACVPLLAMDEPTEGEVQVERRPRGPAVALIPRRPDRPADPLAIRYPLDGEPHLMRGFDEAMAQSKAESPASVELGAERGNPIHALFLVGQQGKTRVVATGRLVGNTLVTAHDVTESGRTRTYLLVHGKLEGFGPDAKPGAELADGAVLGFVGDSGNPGVVSLYLEARLLREEQDPTKLDLADLVDPATSIPTDVRNVLPLL
jgi:hypothetical protein